jgi:hypothetical protein
MGATLQLERIAQSSPLEGLLRALATGGHACVYGEEGSATTSLLDRAAALLPDSGIRVIRTGAIGPAGLGLPELVSQVVHQWPPEVGGEDRLERAFLALTAPGRGCTQVAVLIDNAQNLAPEAVCYLKLTCQSGPSLRIVLAGTRELRDRVAGPELRWLRDRMGCELDTSAAPRAEPEPASRPQPSASRAARSRAPARIAVGLAVAASVLAAVWTARRDGGSASRAGATTLPVALAAGSSLSSEPALVSPEPAAFAATAVSDVPLATAASAAMQAAAALVPEPAHDEGPDAAALPGAPPAALASNEDRTAVAATFAMVVAPVALEAEAGKAWAESAVVPLAQLAETPAAPLASTDRLIELAVIDPAPPLAAMLAPVPVLARPSKDAGPLRRAEFRRTVPAVQLHPERSAGFAAQHCRAIVVKAQLGEDPSDADRDFLRRGCPAER